MECRVYVVLDIDRWSLCFNKEFADAANTEAVIGGLCDAANFYGIFVDNVLIRLGIALLVVYVPSQELKKWVNELPPKLGFVVLT